MGKMIGVRLVQMAILFLVFLTILFFMLQAAPGDPSQKFVGNPAIPPEARQILIQRFGFDQSLWQQYVKYITNFFQGDLGVSFNQYPTPVMEILAERMPRTIWLFGAATLAAYYFGFVLGKVLAWRRDSFAEYGITITGVFLFTVFVPWFAIMMIWFFAFILGWFPTGKFLDPSLWRNTAFTANDVFAKILISLAIVSVVFGVLHQITRRMGDHPGRRRAVGWGGSAVIIGGFLAFWLPQEQLRYALDILWHTILPTLTVALIAFGGVMLLMRTAMLETLREDYVLTARAKGLPDKVVRDRHAARNALLPVVTSLVLALAAIIGGGIVTESIFAWPGMGQALLNAAVVGDIPVAMGALAFIGILALIGHLVVDLLYGYLDPRIRYNH